MTNLPGAGLPPAVPIAVPAAAALLAIETAGSRCSAAVVRDGAVLANESRTLRHGHGEALMPMVERVMAEAALRPAQLDTVAVAIGPGGFTGIRVGLAAAQGIALAVGARLVGVSGFAAVAAQIIETGDAAGCERLLVTLDSRRADLYVQLFALASAQPLAAPQAVLPDQLADYVASLMPDLRQRRSLPQGSTALLIAGDAADAAASALGASVRLAIAGGSAPDALGVAAAALRDLRKAGIAAAVRPLYLRPPDVTLPSRREPGFGVRP